MRERLNVKRSLSFPESLADKIQVEADRLNVPFAEIVRECVINDLPRLRERERKRIKKRNQALKPSQA